MIVTGHQLNFIPGVSVLRKFAAADAVIHMDEMQYARHGFVNRNRFSDGAWITIPVADADTFAPINRVRIADPEHRARRKAARTLEHRLGAALAAPFVAELAKPYGLLAGLNERLLRLLMDGLGIRPVEHAQSRLAAGRYMDTSEGLAMMVEEVGGTVWLSGPSGRRYLDHAPFEARGIDVRYFEFEGPNPTALELLRRPKDLEDADVRDARGLPDAA